MESTTNPSVTIEVAGNELRPVIERLAQLERHDLSEFRGSMPDENGLFAYTRLPLFFGEPGYRAFVIRHGGDIAGFALTRVRAEDGATSIVSFFVVRALRRSGVGYRAALALLAERPGPWAIAYQEVNQGAARFWRRVVTAAVGSAWREVRVPVPAPAPADLPPDIWLHLDVEPG